MEFLKKYPIYEMDQVYLVMDSWNSSIYEMDKTQVWISVNIQFTKWTKSLGKDSWNSSIYEMDQSYFVMFRKCAIYEMAKIQV